MKKIIEIKELPTIPRADIKDTAYVGIILKGNKFIVVITNSGTTPYTLMDKDTRISKLSHNSVQRLLEQNNYDEAFEFEDSKEMYNWFSQ